MASSMVTQSTTSSEYMLGPELGAIIVDRYEGGFDEQGCYSGQGEAIFRSGNTYSGEFRRGVMDGRGRYTWLSDGTVYEGDLSKNELLGEGRYTWSNGSSYVGGVIEGLRNGHGIFTSADGTLVYEGSWKMSKRQGYGEQRYGVGTKDVSTYAGDWHENCRHGRGTMTYASGNVYEGSWVEDRKEGKGIMNWVESRERYTGDWKQDLQCGYGEHVWIEERPVSSVSMDTQKQMCNVYRGEWLDGMRHGKGTFMYADGSRHTGQWYKNKKHGPAVFMSDNGRTFEGLFDNDAMVGKLGQDDEHPELSAAVKLKIADIVSSGDEATRVAAVRDVERSALQINSDLKFLYKHYAKPEVTAPRDSTMFTMSMEQFVVLARDCRALAPSTPVTVGEVYRMFFCMRRQHAFELNKSLERAIMARESTCLSSNSRASSSNNRPSSKGSNVGGLVGRGGGDRGGQRGDGSSVEGHEQALCTSPSGYETESGIYDSRRAITFRECVEGIVRLARTVRLHTGTGNSSNTNLPFPRGSNTNAVAAGLSTTPRTPALARIGTARIEGGGSLSLSGGGGSTTSNANVAAAAGGFGQDEVAEGLAQGRTVQSVNADFKQFVATHLSDLLAKLATQNAVGGGAGRAGGKGGGKGGGSSRGGRGGGGTVAAKRAVGSAAGSNRGEEEPSPGESACVKEFSGVEEQVSRLYRNYSGPLLVPMTLRSLLRMVIQDADLRKRAGLTSEDVKQVFKQANAFLRSRDGPTPTTPENAGLTGQTGAGATEATGPERKESVLGELLGPSAVVAVGGAGGSGGAGGLPLPTVDSATVCLVGTTPSTVDLDLLDQELMPDEFKVVLAGLFELARGKTAPPSSATVVTAAPGLELSPDEPVGSDEPVSPEESGGAGREGERHNEPVIFSGGEKNKNKNAATQPVATEETADSPTASEDDGGQGSGSAMLVGEGEEACASVAGTAPPDWLTDPKMFVLRVLQWTEERSAKRSKVVRAKPPKRVFPL